MKVLWRLLLTAAGLVFALSLLVMMIALLALWGLHALWSKLTGRRVKPFAMRMSPQAGFNRVFKQADKSRQEQQKPPGCTVENVTDVEPKQPFKL